jgi:hypothetical protein
MTKRPIYLNKQLNDYCTRSRNEYIRKITEKYDLEGNKPKIKTAYDDSEKPKFNFYHFIAFLSISYVTYFFYKRIK